MKTEIPLVVLCELDRPGHVGRLIRGLIHNINGPLQNISMLLELMDRHHRRLQDEIRQVLSEFQEAEKIFDSQTKRLERLDGQVSLFKEMLRDFMVVHEIEENDSEVDVNLVVEKLGKVFHADLFCKHHVHLRIRTAPRVPLVRVLGRHLLPATMHLMENALTAVRASPEKVIHLETRLGDDLMIAVRDSGCGIPRGRDVSELFEPLCSWWPDEVLSLERGRSHHGVGLFLVRELLKPYGAKVELEPVQGGGTEARIRLPLS